MRKVIFWSFFTLILVSCGSEYFKEVEETFENGDPKLVKYYNNESKEVLVKEISYYDDGSKYIEGAYQNNERNGTWTAYFRNGNVWSQAEYVDGEEHGLKRVYFENGQIYYEGHKINNQRTGTWKFWDIEGNLTKEVNYDK